SFSIISTFAFSQELELVESIKDSDTGIDGLKHAVSVVVSPDNNHVYVAARGENKISVFSRNTTTGKLTFVEYHSSNIGIASEITVSPDGNHVYLANLSSSVFTVFSRNTSTGALTFVEKITGLDKSTAVTLSTDNKNVYVTSWNDYSLTNYTRDTSTGKLTSLESFADPWWGGGSAVGIEGPNAVVVSPDDKFVYVAGASANCIVLFSRNTSTGALTYVEKYCDGSSGIDGLDAVYGLHVSPDSTHLYSVGYDDDAVSVFTRNLSDGKLTFVEVLKDGSGGIDCLDGAASVFVAPDNKRVYVASKNDNAVVSFIRDSSTGKLTFLQVLKNSQTKSHTAYGKLTTAVTSPDNKHLYVAGYEPDGVSVFSITVDTTVPTVSSVSSTTADGTYIVGDVIAITTTF
ncbi:uncharacterized protein METZ01_LOCUS287827, partial [marine metagenome]